MRKILVPVLIASLWLSAALAQAPTVTKPNVSNTLTQCATNAPVVGNGSGSAPICHPTGALGSAAFVNTGTSGGTIPLLNAANTWGATQAFAAMTATTHNGLTITTTTGTLTIANSKTATISNTLTFTGTDGSSVAFGAGGTVFYSGALGSGVAGTLAVAINTTNGFPVYSVGSWTPVITTSGTVGTPSYAANGQVGSYEAIGRSVFARFSIVLTGWTGSPTGNVSISGLPLTSANIAGDFGGCHIHSYVVAGLAASNSMMGGQIAPNTSVVALTQGSTTTTALITAAQVGTSAATLFGFCNYHI